MFRRSVCLILSAGALLGAVAAPGAIRVTVPAAPAGDAGGRLLLFTQPATAANARADTVDLGDPAAATVVAARDMGDVGLGRKIAFDRSAASFPTPFDGLAPGSYRIQAVFDRNRDYAYAGRGPGDLVSPVQTVRLPLTQDATIAIDRTLPPAPAEFDTAGLPPVAAAQIAASRPHLHDERLPAPALTRFRHTPQSVRAWVLTPPGYDPAARRPYPTVYTAGGFGTDHRQDGQQLSRIWHLMETGAIPPMIWVALDYATPAGTTEFADSASNGPWGDALMRDIIPRLERRYRMDG